MIPSVSHQVTFFLDPADVLDLEERIKPLGPYIVLRDRAPGPEPRIVDGLLDAEAGEPWTSHYLVRPEHLAGVVTEHIAAQGYWSVDEVPSPVIQFHGCSLGEGILRRGRIFYEDAFYDSANQPHLKPEAFRSWAKKVLERVKKGLRREGRNYIGPGADAWLASGGGKLSSL